MIYSIDSDMSTFKNLQFQPGLNLILADKSPGATERQTRNGAGKSSLTELIHFLLGANLDKSSIFAAQALRQYSFRMKFDLGQTQGQVTRTGATPNRVTLQGFNAEGQSTELMGNSLFGKLDIPDTRSIPNTQWKTELGKLMFGLPESEEKAQTTRFIPSFRSLFSYFVRRQSAGGFSSPIKHTTHQQLWDPQVSIFYLLGLDWTIPQQWQYIREREKSLKELKKAADAGTLGTIIGRTAELRTMLTLAENRARTLKAHVNNFQILPEYRNLEQEADQLTHSLATLADENTIDRRLLSELQEALRHESAPATTDFEHLYEEAKVTLPDSVIRRFEDVRLFHESIITNRKSYLDSEVIAAGQRIKLRQEQMEKFSDRRTQIMAILQSHGALDQLAKLQSELAEQEAKTESIRQKFAAAEQLEGSKSALEFERKQLESRLHQDYHEQADLLQYAILVFNKFSSALYEEAGNLTIDVSSNGPLFDVTILGEKSKGISNMQIFCFDMMLMQICMERRIGPGFLVHDSHLFDGVDERQVAKALQIGEHAARELNFQYIVTMNSDAVPKDLPNDFDLSQYIVPTRFTDATEKGGLFGIRF